MEMLQNDLLVLIFSGDVRTRDLNRRLLGELAAKGGQCEEIGTEAALPALRIPIGNPQLLPILEIVPVQFLTLALAGIAGREAGFFERATKITDIE
jgi:glucosamine--fructose-6-phosphate aminotransferase (isomerizing)